jgi:hypothetical protein
MCISLSVDGGATFPYTLSESTANDGSESVRLPNVATTHARIRIEAVGNIFFDLTDADFAIYAAPELSNDAPAGGATVQYSDAPVPSVTVAASDADTAGSALSATAAGLPSGTSLALAATSADEDRPGTRTWTVTGTTDAAPGAYPVLVTVTDDTGAVRTTSFLVLVSREDAAAAYTGDLLAFASPSGGTTALLRATVRDGSVLAGSGDTTPGDVRTATVTFSEGRTTLCTAPVGLLRAHPTLGSAACGATLAAGTHTVTVAVGGSYVGSASATVRVAAPDGSFLTGDGFLSPSRSAGRYPANPGSRTDFQLVAQYDEKLSGSATVRCGRASVPTRSAAPRWSLSAQAAAARTCGPRRASTT